MYRRRGFRRALKPAMLWMNNSRRYLVWLVKYCMYNYGNILYFNIYIISYVLHTSNSTLSLLEIAAYELVLVRWSPSCPHNMLVSWGSISMVRGEMEAQCLCCHSKSLSWGSHVMACGSIWGMEVWYLFRFGLSGWSMGFKLASLLFGRIGGIAPLFRCKLGG